MKLDGLLKPVLVALIAALLIYGVAYTGIEHLRTRKGPWQVTFTNNPAGSPVLIIDHPILAITNVSVVFQGPATPLNYSPQTRAFDQPHPVPYTNLPFGRCIFMDTTFLPGTLVFEMFGHAIQLIPRVLTVDGREEPWRPGSTILLSESTNHPAQ